MQQWHFDKGASHHPDLSVLSIAEEYKGPNHVSVANVQGLMISHTGNSQIHTPTSFFCLSNVLHFPQVSKPLLFVQKFTSNKNCYIEFWPSCFLFNDPHTKAIVHRGPSEHGLYPL